MSADADDVTGVGPRSGLTTTPGMRTLVEGIVVIQNSTSNLQDELKSILLIGLQRAQLGARISPRIRDRRQPLPILEDLQAPHIRFSQDQSGPFQRHARLRHMPQFQLGRSGGVEAVFLEDGVLERPEIL